MFICCVIVASIAADGMCTVTPTRYAVTFLLINFRQHNPKKNTITDRHSKTAQSYLSCTSHQVLYHLGQDLNHRDVSNSGQGHGGC